MKIKLNNGLTVLLKEQNYSPVVALQVWVNVGSTDENEENAGYAHFIEHLLFKGTKNRGVGLVAKEVESSGGDINAFTSFNQTVYQIVIASRFFQTALDIISDLIQNPIFDPEEIVREKEVILEEIKRSEDTPSQVSNKSLFETAYKTHNYRRPVIGYEKVIKNSTRDKLVEFFNRWYVPNNMVLALCGDFDVKKVIPMVQEAFSAIKPKDVNRVEQKEGPQDGIRLNVKSSNIQEGYLNIAFHIPEITHEDIYALDLLSIILGQGDSSRLYSEVKTRKEYVTSIFSHTFTPKDPGLFIINSILQPKNINKALKAILTELYSLKHTTVTSGEIERAKILIEKDFTYQRETVQGQARKMGFFETTMGEHEFEQIYMNKIIYVTKKDIQRVCRKYLNNANQTLTILLPEKDFKKIKKEELIEITEKVDLEVVKKFTHLKDKKIECGSINKFNIKNGPVLITKECHHIPLVSLKFAFVAGLRHETVKNNGINNLLCSVWPKGTKKMDQFQLAEALESIGGLFKVSSGRNSICISMDILSRFFDQGMELFVDILKNPLFDEKIIESEKKQILLEIKAQEDNLPAEVFKLFSRNLYKKHPFGLSILGTKETVMNLSRNDLLKYYRDFTNINNGIFSVVGDIDTDKIYKTIESHFGNSVVKPFKIPETVKEGGLKESILVEEKRNKKQAHIVMGFRGVDFSNKDRYSLEIISSILAGQAGRLFLKLRDQQSLAYSLTSFNMEGIDPGYFAIYIGTSPEKIDQALAGIRNEIDLLRKEKISFEELSRAKKYIVGNYEIELQQNSSQSSSMVFNELYGLGYKEIYEYATKVMQPTPEDILRVSRQYLDLDRCVTAIIRP